MILTSILATIFVLGLLIFVHELGHFVVAKRMGVRVERFSLGYPPKMIGFKRGDTEYCISWIPFGGYVKMAGENPDENEIKGHPYEFQSKPVRVRAAIIAAGPLMNFITAILIMWAVFFLVGMAVPDTDSTKIGILTPDGPAEKAGLMPGDEVISINGQEVSTFSDMAEIIYKQVEKPIVVQWIRDGKVYLATVTTYKDKVLDENGRTMEVGKIGIGPDTKVIPLGFFESLKQGITASAALVVEIFKFLYGLVTSSVSIKAVGGPVLIAQVAGQAANQGLANLLMFTAFLSINLGLLNILPIPVLDGGHLVFLGIEKIMGRPLSLNKRLIIQQIGMALLLLLMIVVTYNDIARLFD